MTAADFLAEADALGRDVAQVQPSTFDFDAPLPDLHIRAIRGWEVGE